MGSVGYWFREHHLSSISLKADTANLLQDLWLGVLLLTLGVIAFSTFVILAYPVLAHILS